MATPDVHYILTVNIDTDGSARFASFSKLLLQKVKDGLEGGVAGPVDFGHGDEQSFGSGMLTRSS